MKTINVDSHNVPATARSKNYQTALATTSSSGGGATTPTVVTPTGGAADTAKVAQNLAEDSTDWAKILRKDIDERTENALSIGKNLTVDGQALLNDVVANTGTFSGMLKAAAATITGALLASTVSATTMNSTTFIGELQGNAATATRLQTPRTIWGQNFDGTGNITGRITLSSDNDLSPNGESHLSYGVYSDPHPGTSVALKISGGLAVGSFLYVNGNMRVTSDIYSDATVGTRNFASHTTGWRADANGNADFRNIYADELRVQAFTADISQALAGSDYLTKSVSKLSANFVVPSVNSTVRIIVDDIEGMPATQCFTNGDYIRFRAFNRTSGLTIANVWGTVVLDTTFGTNGFSNGTQAYTFTCTQTTGAGLTVFKGSEVLDYGISGSGLIARTTLDAMGSPYEQIATWVNDPSIASNYTVHARLGNLGGIANCNGYGLYTDNGFFTGKIVIGDLTKSGNYLSFDSVNGLQIKLGSTSVATTTDVKNSLTTANTNAQGYAATAQTNAINTASSDATTKANAAYSNAVSYTNTQITATNNSITAAVNGIQIGGRNLLTDTKTFANYNNYNFWTKEGIQYKGLDVFSKSGAWLGLNKPITLESGKVYTFSAYVKGDSNCSVYIFGGTNLNGASFGNITEWTRIHCTFIADANTYNPSVNNVNGGSYIAVCGYSLIEGNKGYEDWSPAPEDVDDSISTAQSTAIGTAASNAAALYVTQSAYSSQVTILQDSINAKVSQTDFNALGTRVTSAESTITQHSTDIASKVAQTDYTGNTIASLINQTATTVTIQASKINLVGAVTIGAIDKSSVTPSALGAATPTDVSTAVDNIQVGGRNLLLNSSFSDTLNKWSYGSDVSTIVESSLQMTNNASQTNNRTTQSVFNIEGSTQYTVSIYIKSLTAGAECGIYLWENNGNTANYRDNYHSFNTTGWKSFTITTQPDCTYISVFIQLSTASSTVQFKQIKLEKGNKATDYTPAPEDVAQDAQNRVDELSRAHGGLTYLDAHSIYTGTLTANQVNAVGIDAGSITVGTLNDDRIDAVSVVAKGIVAQTIDAQSATISNLNVVNATVSGTLNGVSGTFNYLKATGSSGRLIFANTYGSLAIEDDDFIQQGTKNNRTLRFLSSNIRCRGSFGASSLNMARVHDTVIDYYVNGDLNSYVRFNLQSNGVGGYYIPLYPSSVTGYDSVYGNAVLGDEKGFPVDLVVFDNSAVYNYELVRGNPNKKVTVINANNNFNGIYLNINGATDWKLQGGKVQTFINIREFTTPLVSTSVHGAGWVLCGEYDNNWT